MNEKFVVFKDFVPYFVDPPLPVVETDNVKNINAIDVLSKTDIEKTVEAAKMFINAMPSSAKDVEQRFSISNIFCEAVQTKVPGMRREEIGKPYDLIFNEEHKISVKICTSKSNRPISIAAGGSYVRNPYLSKPSSIHISNFRRSGTIDHMHILSNLDFVFLMVVQMHPSGQGAIGVISKYNIQKHVRIDDIEVNNNESLHITIQRQEYWDILEYFKFNIPSEKHLDKLNKIHREMEQEKMKKLFECGRKY
jgi:hypothetical protein